MGLLLFSLQFTRNIYDVRFILTPIHLILNYLRILVSKANYILDNVRVFSSRTTDFTSGGGTAYFSVVSEISPVLIGFLVARLFYGILG